jgi:hypothetical protein
MLSEEDKRRIQAEEDYRAKIRGREKPVKTEGFTDKLNRVRMWFALIVGGLLIVLGMAMGK